ncbi:MAG: L-fucose mutarotase [Victivallales bacterium]|nr:L-fucose mutarotase [Victivallales bacterium]
MLKGISPLLSPELLKTLCEMGHGDYIVLADAHFPAHSLGPQVIRADGLKIDDLLRGIIPLFELDSYVESPVTMMAPVPGDHLDDEYVAICEHITGKKAGYLERFAFYEHARKAFAIVQTGETRQYGNIILQKGVIL